VLDQVDDALAAAQQAYPRLLSEGDHHRLLRPLALIVALQGRLDAAARIAAFDDSIQLRSGENADVFAPPVGGRLDALLTGLTSEERARLAREGASLDETHAFRLAFGEVT